MKKISVLILSLGILASNQVYANKSFKHDSVLFNPMNMRDGYIGNKSGLEVQSKPKPDNGLSGNNSNIEKPENGGSNGIRPAFSNKCNDFLTDIANGYGEIVNYQTLGNKKRMWILRNYIKAGTSKITYIPGDFNQAPIYNLEFHDGLSNAYNCPTVNYNGNWRKWATGDGGK